jgi:hypothetical protein
MSSGGLNKMSEKTRSQDLSFKKDFHISFGEETDIQKARRWAKTKPFLVSFLLLALIQWFEDLIIEGKVKREMASVDRQVEEITKVWDKEDNERQKAQVVYQEQASEVEGLPEMRITNKAFVHPERGQGDWIANDPNSWYYGPLGVFEETEEGTSE